MLNAVPVDAPDLDLRLLDDLVAQVETVFRGKRETVRLSVAALLARGHLLFEDVPGVGKTTLARALTAALGLDFRRIQFTSDLLPSDVLGVSVYNPRTHEFETRPGPIFTNMVLADEINRAPPRTQSGLLEAMQEGRVTIDERSFDLPRPFLVMATQNPLEQHGTYPLPESQLDRFMMRLSIGYPDADEERTVLLQSSGVHDPIDRIRPVLNPQSVVQMQDRVDSVHADPSIIDYLMAMVQATRTEPRFRAGASTRGAIALLRAARGYALVDGREFLVPDDVRRLAGPVLAHRLLPAGASAATGEAYGEAVMLLDEIIARIPVPV
ncbi:AAA family ATPase [Longimicrobium terrae]|uniref:MoxR-like ATPase n=1 Tax=Longimicrobium terrae TaxID=1639882 RepID=A0A841H7K3_9BACT|nr:MoxR family ATPase [Longimicrobium terrae]MBB4639573.1 MoxR-like ATPase [Longimicrobium terrae]MBB6073968.1 MoxR-like ATPase [Longimicrobium terrae]NNC29132.1 MoxR family ATPase [Longimicrobium terrae]